MTTPVTIKSTGVTSTSFRIWAATFIPALLSAVVTFIQPTSTVHQAVFGGGAAGVALLSTLGKLWHDGSLNKATLATAGSDIAAALPTLRADLSKAVSFVEEDLPGVKVDLTGLASRLTAVEAKVTSAVPDAAGIEATIRAVLTEMFAKQTPPAP